VVSLGSTNGYYKIDSGQQFQTDYIAKEDKVYKSVNVTVTSEYNSTGSDASEDLNIYAVINGSEYSVTNGNTKSIANFSDDGLKIKIENNTIAENTFALTFPFTFQQLEILLKNIDVMYSNG